MNVAMINQAAPSIASSAMLVELNISVWTARKLDKRASEEVVHAKNANKGIANVNKKLLGDCAELDAVQKFTANARNMHYSMTLPWSDSGLRLLPTTQYFKYHQAITDVQAETERLVSEFMKAYTWEVSQAQVKLGDLFNRDDYPTEDSVRSKFRFRVNYIPLPDAGDFRVDIGNEARDALAEQYSKYYEGQLKSAMDDVWQRAFDALNKMSERLDYGDSDTKKIFRDSLVDNLMEVVDIMEACNITKDPRMNQAQLDISRALRGVTADALREDPHLRATTKQTVDQIIKSLPGMGM